MDNGMGIDYGSEEWVGWRGAKEQSNFGTVLIA